MNRKLLEQLYQTYYSEIYLYIYSICKSRSAAEDLAQETFLKAILSLPDSHTNMRAWLYKVARNLTYNVLKKSARQTLAESEDFCDKKENMPLDRLLQKEQYQALYAAIKNLPEIRREVLVMQYFGGLSQREIAAVLHLTPENVRVIASRGRKELKTYLEGEK